MVVNIFKVIVFEDFITNTKNCVAEICEFLQIDFNDFKEEDLNIHSNKTNTPKNEKLQLMRNLLLKYYANHRYASHLPMRPDHQEKISLSHKMIDKIHKKLNPMQERVKYKANPSTVTYLDEYFKVYLEGLDELVRKDITSKWFF